MKTIILFLLISSVALAQNFEPIFNKALAQEKMNAEERKLLVKLVIRKYDLYLNYLHKASQQTNGELAQVLLKSGQTPPREDEGNNRLGAAVGWFIEYQGNKMTAFPILSKIHPDAAAQKAGMKIGDVVWKLEGESLHHAHSRNRFIELLKIWPDGEPMHIEVKRNHREHSMRFYADRGKKAKFTVNLPKRKL